ncbi:MAG: hypothetical protein ABIP94_03820, partial [Planctomycetota bacterium]
MPSFLDDTTTQVDAEVSETTWEDAGGAPPAEDAFEALAPGSLEDPEPEPMDVVGPVSTPRRRSSERANLLGSGNGNGNEGSLAIVFGSVLLLGSIALAFLPGADQGTSWLARMGLEPRTLTVLGALVVVSGLLRRAIAGLHKRLDAAEGQSNGVDALQATLQEGLQFLVDAQHASNERPPAAGEELQHVLVSLQRQDEKVNNLTKAIKMYGKPLMEISGQGTELAGGVGMVKTAVDVGTEATKQAFARLETQLRSVGGPKQEFVELQ